MFENIDEALTWVMGRHKGGMTFQAFKDICTELGNPQDDFYMVHVAGTDGKGSTVTFLRDLLMSQGFKVGTLQSPHYITHLDRIRLNGENIPSAAFLRIVNEHYVFFVEKALGMFEIDYLVMCQFFKEEKIDIAIIEVGLGGRLDSTNVVKKPALSIITTIGYDHMDRLGNTLEEICLEKCGIIKNDSKVLIGHLALPLQQLVKQKADERHCSFYELGSFNDKGERCFEYEGREFKLLSLAKYQQHNASLALKALTILATDLHFAIDWQKAKEALVHSNWKGRFEVVKTKPRVILDGAHNIHGIGALMASFDELTGTKCIIFSALKRKEYHKMIELLNGHADKVILTTFAYYEAFKKEDLTIENIDIIPDYPQAIDWAMGKYENILICGSLYFISEIVNNINFESR